MPAINITDLINAQLDVNTIAGVANSSTLTVTDRLGNTKNTLVGMNAAVLASAAAVQGSIGYLPPVAYAAGISLTLAAQTVGYSGQTYAPLSSALPFTTSGTFETAKFRLIQGVSGADLASSTGAGLVGVSQFESGSVARTVQSKLRDLISVFDFMTAAQIAAVQAKTFLVDVTAAVQLAINACAATGRVLFIPAGTYKLTPATANTDAAGSNLSALTIVSGMSIWAEIGAIFRIAANVSTNAAPVRHSMFFSNQFLSNLSWYGLIMDMNGANNLMSPSRPTTYTRFTQAHIIFSSPATNTGADDVRIERCSFINTAGVSCIVTCQNNTAGITLGQRWLIANNVFSNNGLDSVDHSSVFGWSENMVVRGNTFENPTMCAGSMNTGGQCAYEIHGSHTRFIGNRILNYYRAIYVSTNFTAPVIVNTDISSNTATVSSMFVEFYAQTTPESRISQVSIRGNVVELSNTTTLDTVKTCVRIGSIKQPQLVRIENNICRSYSTTQDSVLVLVIVPPAAMVSGDTLIIANNTGAGLVAGLVVYFSGTGSVLNWGSITFSNNSLGALVASPSGLYQNKDVYLYGPSAGKIGALRLYGLETPITPVGTDGAVGGRATVYGKALLTLPVTWAGITLGNATQTNKIALDTDSGIAVVHLLLIAGSTTVASGPIYPTITGLQANANGVMSSLIKYGATPFVLAGEIDNTASYIQPYSNAGYLTNASPATYTTSTNLFVSGNFPCASANI